MANSLANFDDADPKFVINSPRSLRACKQEGVLPVDLVYKPIEAFQERNLSPKLVKLRYDFFEAKRRDLLAASRRARDAILSEERREKETASQALDVIARETGFSKGTILALNSDGLKAERQKLLKAQERERNWLKSALDNELKQLKQIESMSVHHKEVDKDAEVKQDYMSQRLKELNDRKVQEEERKQMEMEARQKLEKQIAKEEFLKAQEELSKKEEEDALRQKEAYERQVKEMEKKKQAEIDKQERKEAHFKEQEARKAEMRAQDLRRQDIMEQQRAAFQSQMADKKDERQMRAQKGIEKSHEIEQRRREEFEERQRQEKQREERMLQTRALEQEESAKRAFQTMMRRQMIQEEAKQKQEYRRVAILEQQDENELRLLDHEQKKERYLDFKRELDTLRGKNKEINVERQRRREDAMREQIAEQVRKKDEKVDAMINERKRLWQLRKAQQTEAYRAREHIRSEIMRQRIASKYNSKLLEHRMKEMDLAPSSSMPNLRKAGARVCGSSDMRASGTLPGGSQLPVACMVAA